MHMGIDKAWQHDGERRKAHVSLIHWLTDDCSDPASGVNAQFAIDKSIGRQNGTANHWGSVGN
jgi:hypothetical protein